MVARSRKSDLPFATVFGCSHCSYFLAANREKSRFDQSREWPTVGGRFIRGASVAGLRPKPSTLDTKSVIKEGCTKAKRLVLAFGQVDLEVGYYYRNVIKDERVTPDEYTGWLVDIYREFINGLDFPKDQLAIKGVNVTTFTNPDYTFNYTRRIIRRDVDRSRVGEFRSKLKEVNLSEADQNKMHFQYNEKLNQLSSEIGGRYFDMNNFLAKKDENGIARPELGVDRMYIPGDVNHHIVDTVPVREAHLDALLKVFQD